MEFGGTHSEDIVSFLLLLGDRLTSGRVDDFPGDGRAVPVHVS